MSRPTLGWALCTGALLVASCSSPSVGPTDVTQDPPLGAPADFSITFEPTLDGQNAIRMTWSGVSGATGYMVEGGTGSLAADILQASTSATRYDWVNAPPGATYVRVKAVGGNEVSAPSTEVRLVVFDFRDYVEAIFLGSGPLVPSDGLAACPYRHRYTRFRPGRRVRALIGSSVPEESRTVIRETIADFAVLTHGGLDVTVMDVDHPDPIPVPNQDHVTFAVVPDTFPLCRLRNGGCAIPATAMGTLFGARIVLEPHLPPSTWTHEIGHAMLGMCHIDGNHIGGGDLSVMAAGPNIFRPNVAERARPQFGSTFSARTFTDLDREALGAVFGAGMAPGAQRADFVARGLAKP